MPNFDSLQDELAALCQRHHIIKLALFGSLARGEARPDSDVDLLAEFAPSYRLTWDAFWQASQDLSALFGGRRVELQTYRSLKPAYREAILSDALPLYEEK